MFDFDELEASKPSESVERVWAMSDLHTDAKENLDFIERLDSLAHRRDVLVLAGDISDNMAVVRQTVRSLRRKFARVFLVPGNHDLWVQRQQAADGCADSLAKLAALERLCAEEGVDTRPCRLAAASRRGTVGLWVVPLLSWHCPSFDSEPEIDERWRGIPRAEQVCSDYRLCRWPAPLDSFDDSVAEHFDALNDERPVEAGEDASRLEALMSGSRESGEVVISFSHFLPRIELLPEKRYLYFPTLAKFVGSPLLGRRVERLQPDVHVFGHTHFGWDQEIDGIRYLSPPVGMPRERDQRVSTISTGDFLEPAEHEEQPVRPVLVWDHASGFASSYDAGWSGFYRKHRREPQQVLVLPNYVAKMYEWDEQAHGPKSDVTGWQGKTPAWKFGPAWSQGRKRHY